MSAHDSLVKCNEPLVSPGILHGAIFWFCLFAKAESRYVQRLGRFVLTVRLLDAGSAYSAGLSEVKGID